VDLDGVLAAYDGWKGIEHIGSPLPGAADFTRRLREVARVVIYTTRCKEYLENKGDFDGRPAHELAAIVRGWLDRHGFAYDEIYVGQGKPFAVAYVDDRAVPCRPQDAKFPALEFQLAEARVQILLDQMKKYPPGSISQALKDHEEKSGRQGAGRQGPPGHPDRPRRLHRPGGFGSDHRTAGAVGRGQGVLGVLAAPAAL
jgi:hypothetical protein